ncbi:hypothetical protein [Enterobacter hormaechei]|uniref:hypothetical protein n=1 Tax=Enterobacter hormaechei TaxID=158836 RepID=UPI0022F03912|nr:hypothetical protein [Enterobacter hormaechei]MDA4725342.1 hypothetical protein [Enterobacter hormaechei]
MFPKLLEAPGAAGDLNHHFGRPLYDPANFRDRTSSSATTVFRLLPPPDWDMDDDA